MAPGVSAEGLLSIWEDTWGKLTQEWVQKFLEDSRVCQIISYPDTWINIAVSRNRKLEDILKYLVDNEKPQIVAPQHSITIDDDERTKAYLKYVQKSRMSDPAIPDQDWWREN